MPSNASQQYRRAVEVRAFSTSEVEALRRRLEFALKGVKDPKERKRISGEAALFVVQSARARAPKSSKVHYRYRNVTKGKRRAKGTAIKDRVAYVPGNLLLSIRNLKNLRRAVRAVVGPRNFSNGQRNKYGTSERIVDAYYAQMVFGSAIAFRNKVMIPALTEQEKRITRYAAEQIRQLAKIGARTANFADR